jgi:hypothetical protein
MLLKFGDVFGKTSTRLVSCFGKSNN